MSRSMLPVQLGHSVGSPRTAMAGLLGRGLSPQIHARSRQAPLLAGVPSQVTGRHPQVDCRIAIAAFSTNPRCTRGGALRPSTARVWLSTTAAIPPGQQWRPGRHPLVGRTASLAGEAWRRELHLSSRRLKEAKREEVVGKEGASQQAKSPSEQLPEGDLVKPPPQVKAENHVSKYLHLPHYMHRPTKEELLAAATGFWQRLKVRFKWFSIRSMRPWNADEWGAFVSWVMLGHLVWILVGTTTFFSLLIFSINTVFAQETLARWVGDYLTQSAGITVVFESAIVPKWKDGVIEFRNVFVSRRPGQVRSSVSKGSSTDAAAVAAAGRSSAELAAKQDAEDDGNYTQFDVTLNLVNVTLSFVKWWNGKGLLKDVEIKGVRGVVDRTQVQWPTEPVDPYSYRRQHQRGDFEIDSFKLEDLLVTVHNPNRFRPFTVSIYSCELPQLRKQWLFYDILSANHMSGSYDGSLFTIHPRQIHGVPSGIEHDLHSAGLGEPAAWKKFSRLRIDGLKIDHLNRGVEGPFGWIYEGNVDIVADIMIPADVEEGITKVMSEFYERMEEAVTSNRYIHYFDEMRREKQEKLDGPSSTPTPISNPPEVDAESDQLSTAAATSAEPSKQSEGSSSPSSGQSPRAESDSDRRYVVMDMRIHLNDVKAAVPLFSHGLGYVNQALVRPIVAYINAKRTYIPISCRVVKRVSDFDGSWTIYDCGLMNDASAETYAAFARDVEDQQSRSRRLRKVGFWTLSLAIHAIFMGMAGNVI